MALEPTPTSGLFGTSSSVTTDRTATETALTETITTTTTVDTDGGIQLDSVNFIENMRGIAIDFVGYNLRPTRQVAFYFDEMSMSQFVQRPNIINFDNGNMFSGFGRGKEPIIRSGDGAVSEVLWCETDLATSNTRVYVKPWLGAESPIVAGNTFTGFISGVQANVVSYIHSSGETRSGSNTSSIFLSLDANGDTDDYYNGNVVSLFTGETSEITSYNCASRIADVSPAFTEVGANTAYSIGDKRSSYSANSTPRSYTSENGAVCGTFHFPDPSANTNYITTTGDRIFKILDNFANDTNDYTTKAEYRFTSRGMAVEQTQIINRTITTDTQTNIVDINFSQSIWYPDPTAQHFYVPPTYKAGMFLSSVDLFFKNKSDVLPVEVQIRPMIQGHPHSTKILPGATAIKQPSEVKVSDAPDTANSATYTRFTFPSPVYLKPGGDYAFVVLTNAYEYDMYVSEQGQRILGTDRIVTTQPYAFSMFKSQNAKTYTPIQTETVMFRLNKAVFDTSGTIEFEEMKNPSHVGEGNTFYDMFDVQSDAAELTDTSLVFNYKATTNANSTLESTWTEFKPDRPVQLTESKVLFSPAVDTTSFNMNVALSTENTDVSPILWKNRQQLVTVKNKINNMGITSDIISITNVGSGYANGTTNVHFTGPTGTSANGTVEVNGSGEVTKIIMDNEGSGYDDNVTATIYGAGSAATLAVATETGSSGGNGLHRQMSKVVSLLDGFDSGDLRTVLTCIKPPSANVNVYYRVKNALDGEDIRDKNWSKMAQQTSIAKTSRFNTNEQVELEFRPSLTSNNITYTSDVTNTTYNTFNQFQIKVVHSASRPAQTKVPITFDARTIAMPADVF